jgi:hypothetical protein
MISGCLVAAFAGLMAYFISEPLNIDHNLAFVFAGICGWIGPQVLDTFAAMTMKKVGIEINPQEANDESKEENREKESKEENKEK